MYFQEETQAEREFNKLHQARRSKTESKRREVQRRVDQGIRELSREDFSVLAPVDKLKFGRAGGKIVG